MLYTVRPDSDVPIYRQLVDQINAQIRSGTLKAGDRLPTVRDMAEQTGLSCGTVKRVYDCLQEMGDIEMTRRRGTFVKFVRETSDSRKIRAMAAIDTMIRRLSELNFSPSEIRIFVSLKMREWGLRWSGIRIALVTECPELEDCCCEQLRQLGNVSVQLWQLRQVREYPYQLNEQADVILASQEDAAKLRSLLPDATKLIRVAFAPERESIRALMRVQDGKIGILCRSEAFAELVRGYLPERVRQQVTACTDGAGVGVLEDAEYLVTGENGMEPSGTFARSLTDRHRASGTLIAFRFGIDEGSMLFLEERIGRIRDERELHPADPEFP